MKKAKQTGIENIIKRRKSHESYGIPTIFLFLLFTVFYASTARAAVHTVTNLNDSGIGSLRQAILDTNATPDNDTITFGVIGTIVLTSGELVITNSGGLTINGPGANHLTISGNSNSRVFYMTSGNADFNGLTVSGGNGTGFGGDSEGYGGGIYFIGGGTLNLSNMSISNNTAGFGGAIISDSTVNVSNSTISGNSAGQVGGAYFGRATFTLTNTTVTNNSTTFEGGAFCNLNGGTLTLIDSTLSHNRALVNGGGINNAFGGTVILKNTIIAQNTAPIGPDLFRTFYSLGHNLIQNVMDATITGDLTGNVIGQDPLLGNLQNNGGSTFTRALNCGSPAIDAGSNTLIPVGVVTDQRGPGFTRIFDSTVDIGAFESEHPCDSTAPVISANVTGTLGNNGWYTSVVNVSWNVNDPESGISSSTGCGTVGVTTDTSGVTFSCSATSGGGTATQAVTIKRDSTAPATSCGAADGIWHAADVSIACSNTDATSGLVVAADASFSLSTSVVAGTEIASAVTGSRAVCDNAGNCTTAGPIGGHKIDKKAPEITIVSPTSGGYIYNQSIFVNYTCTDGGSLVASCTGTTANGGLLDTGSIGSKAFTVNTTDNVGNVSSMVVNYTVAYRVPTNTDQCKNDSWQTLQRANGTLFNNQGDCVSYVNTGH